MGGHSRKVTSVSKTGEQSEMGSDDEKKTTKKLSLRNKGLSPEAEKDAE